MDAMLAPALAMDAKTRNKLGVVRSFLNAQYDRTVRTMATMEQPAPVLSMVMRTLISSWDKAWPGPGSFMVHSIRCWNGGFVSWGKGWWWRKVRSRREITRFWSQEIFSTYMREGATHDSCRPRMAAAERVCQLPPHRNVWPPLSSITFKSL